MAVIETDRAPIIARATDDSPSSATLRQSWEGRPGVGGWLATVDHKEIGKRYVVTAFIFLIIGGLEALVMRVQLARPNQTLLTPEQYSQLFTMHGVTMIFLYALPVLSGFSNYLWPLLLGSRDMAFPRLNALSYWVFLFAGIFLYSSFVVGKGPDDGWFNYVPYASLAYNPGPNIDVYALGMVLLGISTTAVSYTHLLAWASSRVKIPTATKTSGSLSWLGRSVVHWTIYPIPSKHSILLPRRRWKSTLCRSTTST